MPNDVGLATAIVTPYGGSPGQLGEQLATSLLDLLGSGDGIAVLRSLLSRARDTPSVLDFDRDSSDEGSRFQRAINWANSQNVSNTFRQQIHVPNGQYVFQNPVEMKSYVHLYSDGGPGARIYGSAGTFSGDALFYNDGELRNSGIEGLQFYWSGALDSMLVDVMNFPDRVNACDFKRLRMSTWPGRGIVLQDDTSLACHFDQVKTATMMQHTAAISALAGNSGTIEVRGTDHYMYNCELGNNYSTIVNANMYAAACLWLCSMGSITNTVFQISETGLFLSGVRNRLTANRYDRNLGHGVDVTSGFNSLTADWSVSNGRGADATYYGFINRNQANTYLACRHYHDFATDPGNSCLGGFRDEYAGTVKSNWIQCYDYTNGASSAWTWVGSGLTTNRERISAPLTVTLSGVTSLTCNQHSMLAISAPSAGQTLTSIFGVLRGEMLTVYLAASANSITLTHDSGSTSGLKLLAGANDTMHPGEVRYFWRPTSSSGQLVELFKPLDS